MQGIKHCVEISLGFRFRKLNQSSSVTASSVVQPLHLLFLADKRTCNRQVQLPSLTVQLLLVQRLPPRCPGASLCMPVRNHDSSLICLAAANSIPPNQMLHLVGFITDRKQMEDCRKMVNHAGWPWNPQRGREGSLYV